jgi:excisionase family DNA binding protein
MLHELGAQSISEGVHMARRNATLNHLGETAMVEEMDELLTVHEVARRLRVDDTTVRRWIKSGALPAITLPHRGRRQAYRVKKSTMDTLLKSPHLPE